MHSSCKQEILKILSEGKESTFTKSWHWFESRNMTRGHCAELSSPQVTGTTPSVGVDTSLPSGDAAALKLDAGLPSGGVSGPTGATGLPTFKDPILEETINPPGADVGGASFKGPGADISGPGAGGFKGPDLQASKPLFRGGPVPNLEGAFKNSDGNMQTLDGQVMSVSEYIDLQTAVGGERRGDTSGQFGPHMWADWTALGGSSTLPPAQGTAPSGGLSSAQGTAPSGGLSSAQGTTPSGLSRGEAAGAGAGLGVAALMAGAAAGADDTHAKPEVPPSGQVDEPRRAVDAPSVAVDATGAGVDASGKPHAGFISKIKEKLHSHGHDVEGSASSSEVRAPTAAVSGASAETAGVSAGGILV
jgi:hypothetical protein